MINPEFHDRLLSLGLARVSEAAAIACAPLVGRGDEDAADQAAVDAMRRELNKLDIQGVVVIGEGERDEAPMLYIGEEVGTGCGDRRGPSRSAAACSRATPGCAFGPYRSMSSAALCAAWAGPRSAWSRLKTAIHWLRASSTDSATRWAMLW